MRKLISNKQKMFYIGSALLIGAASTLYKKVSIDFLVVDIQSITVIVLTITLCVQIWNLVSTARLERLRLMPYFTVKNKTEKIVVDMTGNPYQLSLVLNDNVAYSVTFYTPPPDYLSIKNIQDQRLFTIKKPKEAIYIGPYDFIPYALASEKSKKRKIILTYVLFENYFGYRYFQEIYIENTVFRLSKPNRITWLSFFYVTYFWSETVEKFKATRNRLQSK